MAVGFERLEISLDRLLDHRERFPPRLALAHAAGKFGYVHGVAALFRGSNTTSNSRVLPLCIVAVGYASGRHPPEVPIRVPI
jgi:hypothetical protein